MSSLVAETAMTAGMPVRSGIRLYEISNQIRHLLDEATDEETGERRESLVRAARAWRQTAAELERHLPRRAC